MACLRLQELKRRIFPPNVVHDLDFHNAARLAQIRQEWASLLADTEARNRQKLQSLANNEVRGSRGGFNW